MEQPWGMEQLFLLFLLFFFLLLLLVFYFFVFPHFSLFYFKFIFHISFSLINSCIPHSEKDIEKGSLFSSQFWSK